MLRLAVISACLASAVAVPTASRRAAGVDMYDRCGTGGPADWSGSCKGTAQSPIDVCDATTYKPGAALQFNAAYGTAQAFMLDTAGKVQLDFAGKGLSLADAGYLAHKNGRQADQVKNDWDLVQAHFHWGRDKDEGSEHYIEGRQYPLEIHFVHKNKKYADLAAALGKSDGLLVVGQMFEVGETESKAMTALASMSGEVTLTPKDLLTLTGDPGSLVKPEQTGFTAKNGLYSYPGSLTTPTCNEVVTWVVLPKPLPITESSLKAFWAISSGTDKVSKFGNFRPLMPLNDRKVWFSTEACGDACGHVSTLCNPTGAREPDFECDSTGLTNLEIALSTLFALTAFTLCATVAWCRKGGIEEKVINQTVTKVVETPVPVQVMAAPVMGMPMPAL